MNRILRSVFGIILLFGNSMLHAQEDRPGRIDSEERRALEPGLRVEYSSLGSDEISDVSDARLAALYVAEGQPATPFLPPGQFRAVMSGYLKLRLRGEYDFSLEGRGSVKLWFNGELAMEASGDDLSKINPVHLELVKGYNKLTLEYASPADGDAVMRLYWASDEFPAEPIFPEMLMHDGRDEAWLSGKRLRAGRLLFAQNHCLRCHPASDDLTARLTESSHSMPELDSAAPSLSGVGSRISTAWMQNWIVEPQKLRNRTTMPQVLGHERVNHVEVADIAAYLTTLKDEADLPAAESTDDLIDAGLTLFEDRGCIACHRFTSPAEEDEDYNRVSLHYVNQKFRPGALATFLADTHKHYPWNRMPKFDLTKEETLALAAYIRSESKGTLEPFSVMKEPSPTTGKTLFVSKGCANCHGVNPEGAPPKPSATPLAKWNLEAGCLSAEPPNTTPKFPLADEQRTAIGNFVKTGIASLTQTAPAEFSRRQFEEIQCNACHSRDETDADLPYVLLDFGELGHPPEPVPNLTWAGEKLRADWTEKLFLGKIHYRPRPHFKIRMPEFPMRGEMLAKGLSAEHGFGPEQDQRPKFDNKLADIGEKVAAMHTGLACHRCHAIGDKQATAPFEARSTNLSYATERLRYGFFHRWMRDPLRIDPETKMIKFAQDGQKTGLTDIYKGEAQKQFEAIWHHLQVLNEKERPKEAAE